MEDDSAPDDLTKGRLRAEDRRGSIGSEYLVPELQPEAPLDPEEGWEEIQGRRLSHRIMLALALIIPFCAAGFFGFSQLSEKQDSSADRGKNEKAPPLKSFEEKASTTEIQQAIEDCVSGFMQATSNEERCRFLIGGDQLSASLDEYYSRPGVHPPKNFGKILQTDKAAFGGIAMHTVLALETEEASGWVFNILPTQTGMKIDWESSVGYGQQSWEGFQENKPRTPILMRVYFARSAAEEQSTDPRKFGFCKIYTRGSDQSIPGFFSIESELASTMKKIVPPGGRQPVRAKLRWNADGTAVEVLELLHNFWIDLDRYQREFEIQSK